MFAILSRSSIVESLIFLIVYLSYSGYVRLYMSHLKSQT